MTSERIQWSTESAIVLRNREYEAVIIPDAGANCISLVHLPSGDQLLRVPENGRKLREGSNVFGLPLLFPPNRVRDGRFLFHGREQSYSWISSSNSVCLGGGRHVCLQRGCRSPVSLLSVSFYGGKAVHSERTGTVLYSQNRQRKRTANALRTGHSCRSWTAP